MERIVTLCHVDDLVASDRGRSGRDATGLLRGCILRAERVASRYARLDVRPARTSLFPAREPAAGPDAGRGARTDDEGGASRRVQRELLPCSESCWVTVAGSVPQTGRGSGFIDGPRASRPVQSSCARWMVVRRGAKKM